MNLSARVLDAVGSVNIYKAVDSLRMAQGDTTTLYLQLVDSSQDTAAQGFEPAGRRYVPPASSTLQVVLTNLRDDTKVTRFATQPYAGDASIWSLSLGPGDKLRGLVDAILTLTEGSGGPVRSGRACGVLRIDTPGAEVDIDTYTRDPNFQV